MFNLQIIGKILRLFGYVFSSGLSLGLIGVSALTLLTGSESFQLDLVPWWTGTQLAKVLIGANLFGLLATAMAARGKYPILLVLWTGVTLGTMVYAFYYSNLKFDDVDHFRTSLNMTGGALTAFAGSLTGLFGRKQAS